MGSWGQGFRRDFDGGPWGSIRGHRPKVNYFEAKSSTHRAHDSLDDEHAYF